MKVFGQELVAETGHIDKVVDCKGQRVILLDSAVTGQHGGRLEQVQLDWLAAALENAPDMPVTIVLHHHANPLHTRVADFIMNIENYSIDPATYRQYALEAIESGKRLFCLLN